MTPRETIDAYFDALVAGDADRLLSLLSDGFLKIGTDAGEVATGASEIADYYRDHVASTSDFEITTHRLDIEERGTVAWFSIEQTWSVTWKGTPETLEMRITGVLECISDTWKFAQMHASQGIS